MEEQDKMESLDIRGLVSSHSSWGCSVKAKPVNFPAWIEEEKGHNLLPAPEVLVTADDC